MVFFTCGACGESLKKAQVEKHVSLCRGCEVLSCIDCGKDFWGNDYKNHVRCISEDQKYGGRAFEAKANKGDVKQQLWLQKIQVALSKPGVSTSLQNVLQQVATYDNVPRKKSKFENWMKNSLKISNCSLHQQVWDILSAESAPPREDSTPSKAAAPTQAAATVEDGDSYERKKLNKRERKEARRLKNGLKTSQNPASDQAQDQGLDLQDPAVQRKRKHREEQNGSNGKKAKNQSEPIPDPEETQAKEKFNWKGNIKALLRDAPDQELPIKKLRRKVLRAYLSFAAEDNHRSEEQLLSLFNAKIQKNPKFRVLKDRVKLIK